MHRPGFFSQTDMKIYLTPGKRRKWTDESVAFVCVNPDAKRVCMFLGDFDKPYCDYVPFNGRALLFNFRGNQLASFVLEEERRAKSIVSSWFGHDGENVAVLCNVLKDAEGYLHGQAFRESDSKPLFRFLGNNAKIAFGKMATVSDQGVVRLYDVSTGCLRWSLNRDEGLTREFIYATPLFSGVQILFFNGISFRGTWCNEEGIVAFPEIEFQEYLNNSQPSRLLQRFDLCAKYTNDGHWILRDDCAQDDLHFELRDQIWISKRVPACKPWISFEKTRFASKFSVDFACQRSGRGWLGLSTTSNANRVVMRYIEGNSNSKIAFYKSDFGFTSHFWITKCFVTEDRVHYFTDDGDELFWEIRRMNELYALCLERIVRANIFITGLPSSVDEDLRIVRNCCLGSSK